MNIQLTYEETELVLRGLAFLHEASAEEANRIPHNDDAYQEVLDIELLQNRFHQAVFDNFKEKGNKAFWNNLFWWYANMGDYYHGQYMNGFNPRDFQLELACNDGMYAAYAIEHPKGEK